jgi:hypothetical protein
MPLISSFARVVPRVTRATPMAAISRTFTHEADEKTSTITRLFKPVDKFKGTVNDIQLPTQTIIRGHAGWCLG